MKKTFSFAWTLPNGTVYHSGNLTRKRAAYLLHAARSRGDAVVAMVNCYRIGSLYLLKSFNA